MEDIKTWLDTVYWKLLPQEPGGEKIYEDFKVRVNLNGTKPMIVIQNTRENLRWEQEIYPRAKRIKGQGRVRIYELSKFQFESNYYNKMPEGQKEAFIKAVQEDKGLYKKVYDREKRLERKAKLKKEARTKGLTEEQVKEQRRAKRAETLKKKRVAREVDRTQRIMLVAPLLNEIKDEIEVVLKQFNEGRGNIPDPDARVRQLKKALRAVRTFKS